MLKFQHSYAHRWSIENNDNKAIILYIIIHLYSHILGKELV